MKTILITGANGFIGSALYEGVQKILRNEYHIFGTCRQLIFGYPYLYSVDLTHGSEVEKLMDMVRPDIIFHLAAVQQSAPHCFETNVMSTRNIVDFAPEGCRVVFASSSTVYGDLAGKLYRACLETDSPKPTNCYGRSKAKNEEYLFGRAAKGEIEAISLRLCATVGKSNAKGLIKDIYRKLKDDSIPRLDLLGEAPGSVKPFLFIEDVVNAFIHAIDLPQGIYNLGHNDVLSVETVADIIMDQLKIYKDKVWSGPNERLIGDNPLVSLCPDKLEASGFEYKYYGSYEAISAAIEGMEK